MENVKLNNLRIAIRFLLYDVLKSENARLIRDKIIFEPNLRNLINRSGLGINIRTNQDVFFMRGVNRNLGTRIWGNLGSVNVRRAFQYEYELYFAFDDSFTVEDKQTIVNHIRDLHYFLREFLFGQFENVENNLNLKFRTYDTRCFIGLYETPRRNLRGPDINPMRDVVHNPRGRFLRLRNYTPGGFIEDPQEFYRTYVSGFLEQVGDLETEAIADVRNELNQYEASLVIVSPGLSVAAFNLLLNTQSPEVARAIYVSWITRIGFFIDERKFSNWLRNENIASIEPTIRRDSRQWTGLLNFAL